MLMLSGAESGAMIDLVRRLATDVGTIQRALVEARVRLGHVLRSLQRRSSEQDVEHVIAAAGVHRRRASEAMRLAEHFATADGDVDWAKYQRMAAEKGVSGRAVAPSVRSMISLVKPARVPASVVVEEVGNDQDGIVMIDGPEIDGPDADAEYDRVFGENDDSIDLDPMMELGDGGVIVIDDPREAEHLATQAATAAAVKVEKDRRAWAVGAQMTMGELFVRAEGYVDDLERVLERIYPDASTMLKPIRDRLLLASKPR